MMKTLLLITAVTIPGLCAVELTPTNQSKAIKYIDSLVTKELLAKQIKAGKRVSDEKFLRRAYLDIVGRIPTLLEYDKFIESKSPNKRHDLIDTLMDSPGYVSTSLNHWLDTLRAKFFVGKTVGDSYKQWIRNAIQKNMPYDQFVNELLSSEGRLYDPKAGSVGYYLRDRLMVLDNVSNTMQTFLATDMVCAQCHDHPYKKWTRMDFYKLAAFVDGTVINATKLNKESSEALKIFKPKSTREKHSYQNFYKKIYQGVYKGGSGKIELPLDYDYEDGKPGELVNAGVPFGATVKVDYTNEQTKNEYDFVLAVSKSKSSDFSSRKDFAAWITSPQNPMFTKTIVNRLWFRVFGTPLIGNLLDLKESEMGKNPKLTAFLIKIMKFAKYDQKLFMSILYKTNIYQREAIDKSKVKYHYQSPVVKRLSAEEVWDSLLAIRSKKPDTNVIAGRMLPASAAFIEMEKRTKKERVKFISNPKQASSMANKGKDVVPGVGLSSSNVRASLLRSPKGAGSFLDIYGQSEREIIDGAVKEATIPQALHLMNNALYTNLNKQSFLYEKLKKASKKSFKDKIVIIYKTVLSRKPTTAELQLISQLYQSDKKLTDSALTWALINSNEFKLRR